MNLVPRRKAITKSVVFTDQETGCVKRLKLRKNLPFKCSSVRRICVACQVSVIRKTDLNYSSGVCKACSDAHPGCPPPSSPASCGRPSGSLAVDRGE